MNVEAGNSSARGASQNTYAKNIYGRRQTEPIHSHSHDEICWISGPKRNSPSSLISSPDLALALAHHLLCLSPPPPPPPRRRPVSPIHCACTGCREEHQHLREFHHLNNPPQLPTPTNPPNSRALASPPGHSRRKFVTKPRFFFFLVSSLLLSLPRPGPLFLFDSAASVCPFYSDRVFSSEGAVFRGRRPRIHLRTRRFGPQVRFCPPILLVCASGQIFVSVRFLTVFDLFR